MENWIQAGKVAAEVREYSKTILKPGLPVLEFARKVEGKIRELGATPAFPLNISFNDFAAHCTPEHNDQAVFSDQVVKIDLGTCVDGAIGDTAYTVDLSGKHAELVKASEEALNNVIKTMQIGTTLGEIGRTVIETIQSFGYTPIKNLSGHGLGEYSVHENPTIPNFDTGDKTEIEEGMHFAIEPFATTGAGMVKESGIAGIYSVMQAKPVRDMMTRQVMQKIKDYNGLPFAKRWLVEELHEGKVNFAIRQMENQEIIKGYPPLREVRGGLVSQSEHSFIVKDKVITITK